MAARRILYVTDNAPTPMGGALVARLHVRHLRANGFDASLLIRRDEAADFFEGDLPRIRLDGEFTARDSDILVIPEPWNDVLTRFAGQPGRKVVFCQNHHYVYYGIGKAGSYEALGVSTVFCCGDVIAEYLRTVMGYARVPVVHNGIDRHLFQPAPKRRLIAYMPRKMPVEANFLRETFRRRHPRYERVPWAALNGIPQTEVAKVLGDAAVFVALGRIEGVGLPPLEAMAAGCLVAGFTGGGGREYATDDNGLWCGADDWIGCADRIAEAMQLAENPTEETTRRRDAGFATAGRYDLARMEEELLAFWREEIAL
ncbi:MAG TPA: glycosyltransferase family 4 protein [Azospirillum sp.]